MTRDRLIETLAGLIDAVERPHPVRVAIDGVDGAGKTTLAEELVGPLVERGRSVIRASIDGFHRPRDVRYRQGADSPEGYYQDSFDYLALRAALLEPLGPGGSGRYRPACFDHRADRVIEAPAATAGPRAVLLFDGVFLQRPELDGSWDLALFVDVSFEVSAERACRRDAARAGAGAHQADLTMIRNRYRRRYVPGQRLYLAECSPLERAMVIVHNDEPDRPTIDRRSS